jgi:alpha-beta hydrolase superfamily lysophospholipase
METYRPRVESRRSIELIVGADVPVVLPAHSVCGVILATWLATGDDGLPG